jgi:hypothetical protein
MVEHLSNIVDEFPGPANQTRCFSHIINLVARSILRQFDAPKKTKRNDDDDDSEHLDDAVNVLAGLTQELELNKSVLEDDEAESEDEIEDELTNNNEADEDGREGMSDDEVLELEASLTPVRLMLAKVNNDKISNSTAHLIVIAHSFARLPMPSRTHRPSFYLCGTPSLRSLASAFE